MRSQNNHNVANLHHQGPGNDFDGRSPHKSQSKLRTMNSPSGYQSDSQVHTNISMDGHLSGMRAAGRIKKTIN